MDYFQTVKHASQYLASACPPDWRPRVAITLGTGLSNLSDQITPRVRLDYSQIPGFPVSTVQSHASQLILGDLAGQPVAALAGRFHLYEGYSPQQVTLPVRALAELGVECFIFCNAAGGLNLDMDSGRVMLITDHINFTGENPLVGPNQDEWGERFPEMHQVYDPGMMDLARRSAHQQGLTLYEGVYVGVKGPSLETPAETRMLGRLGADAVGMSTVLEVIAAKHHRRRILALSAISNVNDPDDMQPAPIDLIIANAGRAGADLGRIITGVLQAL